MGAEEGTFPDTHDNLQENSRKVLIKQAAVWFRIDGLLDRLLTALRHLAALIVSMENRIPRGPTDYETENSRGVYVKYEGRQEPSWQGYLAKMVAVLITSGVGALVWILSAMNGRLSTIEANQTNSTTMIMQRLDQQEKHMEATDKDVAEIKLEIWPHKR